jgi:hypothetical protein
MQINKRSFVILRQIADSRLFSVGSCKIMDIIQLFCPWEEGWDRGKKRGKNLAVENST